MSNTREFISWRTAFHAAERKLKMSGKTQVVYYQMSGDDRIYKSLPYSTWKIMKPGRLASRLQEPDKNLDGAYKCKTR